MTPWLQFLQLSNFLAFLHSCALIPSLSARPMSTRRWIGRLVCLKLQGYPGHCRSSHRATSNPTLVWPYDVPFHPIGPRTEHMLALPRRTYTHGGRRGTITRFTGGVSSWLLLLGVSAPVASQHLSAHKSYHPNFTCHGPSSYRRAASTNSLRSETRHTSLPQTSPDSLSYSDIILPSF